MVAPLVEFAPPVQAGGYHTRLMPHGFAELLGHSPALVALRDRLQQLVRRYASARRVPSMLLLGETGTGKSLIARALHADGPRAGRPFVDVNCAAIPETLMEAEMFGFERGAFTDARHAKAGLFTAADRGTIFLDEIGLLPEGLQAKLLKVVEEQEVRPLGGTATKPIDVWIIAATSEDLESAIRKRRFREDLYHRLAVVTIRVPPLRERGDDVVLLAEHLLHRACADYGLAAKTLTREALALLKAHPWPGNIRELSNVIERVALLSEPPSVTAEALGLGVATTATEAASEEQGAGRPRTDIDDAIEGVERDHLTRALAAVGGNVTRASQRLGLTRNALRYRLRKYGIHGARDEATGSESASPALAPTPSPSPPTRWERRRIAFLRVALLPLGDDAEHAQRALLEEVMQKIQVFGGTLDGVSPTGLMAVFGLDLPEDAPRRAALAAMAIRKLVARGRDLDPTTADMKVAIHSQASLLWKVSDTVHVDMDARPEIWQTLDTLIARAGAGGIIVSGPTATALRATCHLTGALDGSDGACLLVDGERNIHSRVSGRVFVGRGDDMAMLRGRLELALAGRGQVVGISSEPGIGKSRVLLEFGRLIAPGSVTYLGARCVSYGRDVALLPIIQLVRAAHGIDEEDSSGDARSKLRSNLAALGLAADEMTPYLLRLIGISEGTDTIAHLTPEALHQRTLEIFQRTLLAASRARPLIVAVEDLHWIDRASEGYMVALVQALMEASVLLLTSHRPAYRLPWGDRSYVTELKLQPLARPDARRVLDDALDTDQRRTRLSEDITEAILDRADGNPLFIEELARSIGASPAEHAPVPQSIEAVLLARVDRLPAECKTVLQAASVLGRDVPLRLLEAIAPEVVASKEHLRELERLEYLYDRSDGARERYRFKHAFTQEVAYASILPEDRRRLHARTVGALETQYADRLAEQTELLAHHAVRAQLWRKAADYLRETGSRAAARFANHEAVTCFEGALEALKHLPGGDRTIEVIDLQLALFTPLNVLAEYRRAFGHVADAASLAATLGERGRLGRALALQCMNLRIRGATDEAIEAGRQALVIAGEVGDVDLAYRTNFYLAGVHHARGNFREAAECCRQSFPPLDGEVTAERVRALPRSSVNGRAWLMWSLESLGEFREALAVGREAVQIAKALDVPNLEASASCLLGTTLVDRGDWDGAIPLLERALLLCRSYDVRDWLAPVTMRLGFAYAQIGRLAEGIALLEEGDAHAEAIQNFTAHAIRRATLALAYLLAGRPAEAEATARRSLALAREQRQPAAEATSVHALGLVAAAADRPDAAEGYFRHARDIALALEARPIVARCHFDLGKLYRGVGKHEEARDHLTTATTMYREMDMPFWLAKAEVEMEAVRSRA